MSSSSDMKSARTYTHPAQVLADQRLTRDAKICILRDWYFDATQEAVSESGGDRDRLQAVSSALLELGETPGEGNEEARPLASLRERLDRNFSRLFGERGAQRRSEHDSL